MIDKRKWNLWTFVFYGSILEPDWKRQMRRFMKNILQVFIVLKKF